MQGRWFGLKFPGEQTCRWGSTIAWDMDAELRERWSRKLPAILLLAAASYLFLRSYVYRAPRHVDLSQLNLHRLDGVPIPDGTGRSRAIVLNFWTPWCGPCRQEMPWLNHLQQSHPETLVVGLEDDAEVIPQAQELARSMQVTYLLVQRNDQTRRAFGRVAAYPTTLYISASGRVVHTVTGVVPERVMQYYLKDTEAHP
jgi:thiol-disulfide isomerase/thioredoxin